MGCIIALSITRTDLSTRNVSKKWYWNEHLDCHQRKKIFVEYDRKLLSLKGTPNDHYLQDIKGGCKW